MTIQEAGEEQLLEPLDERRRQKAQKLLQRLQKERDLPQHERAYVAWCASFHRLTDLTLPKLVDVLEEYREARDKRASKGPAEGSRDSSRRKLSPYQRTRREVRAEAFEAYQELLQQSCDFEALAELQGGVAFVAAMSDLLEEFALDAVRGQANSLADREISLRERMAESQSRKARRKEAEPDPKTFADIEIEREIKDSDIARMEKRFTTRLENHLRHAVESYQKQAKVRMAWAFYEGTFHEQWEQVESELREACAQAKVDAESLFAFFREEALQTIRRYQGQWGIHEAKQDLLEILDQLEEAIERRLDEEHQYQRLLSLYEAHSDFASCFPVARSMERKIEFFCGPTNSGKTHAAMDALAASDSGVYLAPLRLLALEGQGNLQSRGVEASYITGEERDIVAGARFISSTIEMLDFHTPIETAIIDEIQLLGEPQRGWAWTNALLGVPAQRIILTGSEDALPLLEKIAQFLGEKLEVKRFHRFNPLVVEEQCSSVEPEHIHRLEPGTAIVCFSRRDVLELKQHIENNTDMKVSVIYGGLAPEVRREEARRFRERQADLLVATDAIAMGLNLPIRTILFWQTSKHFGGETHPLRITEIKQIAGRAGRYGFEDRGYVGAFADEDLARVEEALAVELPPLQGPCLVMPLQFHIDLISEALHTEDLVPILRYFCERIWFSRELFTPTVTEDMLMLARMLEEFTLHLPLDEKYLFACAPVNMRASSVVQAHLEFAHAYGLGQEVFLPPLTRPFRKGSAATLSELRDAEDAVQTATLYTWLAFRFPREFSQLEEAIEARRVINQYISRSLERGRLGRRCSRCNQRLPAGFPHGVCQSCFDKGRSRGGGGGGGRGKGRGGRGKGRGGKRGKKDRRHRW